MNYTHPNEETPAAVNGEGNNQSYQVEGKQPVMIHNIASTRITGCPVPDCESWAATHDGADPSLWSHELPSLDGAAFTTHPVKEGNDSWRIRVEIADQTLDGDQLADLASLIYAEGLRLGFLNNPPYYFSDFVQSEFDRLRGAES